jgi:hypothetical protein
MHSLVTYDHSLLLHASSLSQDGKDQLSHNHGVRRSLLLLDVLPGKTLKIQRFSTQSVIYFVRIIQRISVKFIISKKALTDWSLSWRRTVFYKVGNEFVDINC